jgi:hypothetical protein
MAHSFSYAIFRFVKDASRDISVPVGVALWSTDATYSSTRFVSDHERVRGVSRSDDLPYVDLVRMKIAAWREQGELPYQQRDLSQYSDDWWRHLKTLLIQRVQLSEPLSIDCQDPEVEIEDLFRKMVPVEFDRTIRIDSLLRSALGDTLASRFSRRHLLGYQGKPVEALRTYSGSAGDVVLEAINLSAQNAADQADGIVGKLQRARLNGHGLVPKPRPLTALVGYTSSSHSLNGEAYLKSWIEEGGTARTFDLDKEQAQLREAAADAIHRASYPVLE